MKIKLLSIYLISLLYTLPVNYAIFKILSIVRYSNASLNIDSHFLLGLIIFFLICGIFIVQYQIWQEVDYSRNKKWYKWKAKAIKTNKADLSNLYPNSEWKKY